MDQTVDVKGIGATWVNFGKSEVTTNNLKKVRNGFNLPAHIKPLSLIGAGCPAVRPDCPTRRELADIQEVF